VQQKLSVTVSAAQTEGRARQNHHPTHPSFIQIWPCEDSHLCRGIWVKSPSLGLATLPPLPQPPPVFALTLRCKEH
jgi:hypothetical protein